MKPNESPLPLLAKGRQERELTPTLFVFAREHEPVRNLNAPKDSVTFSFFSFFLSFCPAFSRSFVRSFIPSFGHGCAWGLIVLFPFGTGFPFRLKKTRPASLVARMGTP